MIKSFNHSALVTCANPKPHPATRPHQIMRFGRCRVRGVWMWANCGERAPMMKWVQRARACLCGRWVVVVVEYGDWISGGEHPQCCLEPTPPQHSIVSVQFSLIGTGGIHGWSSFGGAAGAGAGGGGDMTRRKHRTLQSKHVRGADDKPVISPVSWGPGFLSLYKGTSILLMFASKHLSPPPRFCSPPVDGSPFWQPTSQNRTPGASEGSSHI